MLLFCWRVKKYPPQEKLGDRLTDCNLPEGTVRVIPDIFNPDRLSLLVDMRVEGASEIAPEQVAYESVNCATPLGDIDGDGYREPLSGELKDASAVQAVRAGVLGVFNRGNDSAKVNINVKDPEMVIPHMSESERRNINLEVMARQAGVLAAGVVSVVGSVGLKRRARKLRRVDEIKRRHHQAAVALSEDMDKVSVEAGPENTIALTAIFQVYLKYGLEMGQKLLVGTITDFGGVSVENVKKTKKKMGI